LEIKLMTSPRQGITILGATGSIGINTLDVISRHPNRFQVIALTAHNSEERLFQQCLAFRPKYAVLTDLIAAERFSTRARIELPELIVLAGESGLNTVVTLPEVNQVMAAIVGAAGLNSTFAAVRAGKRVLLANKESLVMAGKLFIDTARNCNSQIVPVDSEHNAIFQCLNYDNTRFVRRILLTASGGPFRTLPISQLESVTPEQALAHPTWIMGKKISIDSATMMNKGLEVIEAHWLFDLPSERIEVLIHPQSIVHSLVEYEDRSVLAQLGNPDMRTPISYALSWPERIASGVSSLDFCINRTLSFEPVDRVRFPCVDLAYQALNCGGTASAILNAANEIAVQNFLNRRIRFTDIHQIIEATLAAIPAQGADNLDAIFAADIAAREFAQHLGVST